MSRDHDLKLTITDANVSAVIRYLDPDLNEITEEDGTVLVIHASVAILVLGCIGFLWLYRRLP